MPQFNFQPIYSKYAGNNAATIDKLLTKKEEEYKVGESYMDAYDKLRKSMQAAENLTGDVAAVDDLSKKAIDDIKQFAEKGDYENLYNKIKGSVIDLQAKYTPYSQNKEKYYEDIKNINAQKDWSPNEKASFIAKKTEEYNSGKGLQVDPITGQATGFISMGKMADYYNAQKELMDFTSKITINEGYNEGGFRAEKNPDGTYNGYDSRTNTEWKRRTFEDIKKIGEQYILSSPEIMASLNQKAELDAYNTIKSVDDPKQLLVDINQDIDDKIKAYASQDDKKLTKDKIKEKYNAIQDLKNSKIDINTANPQQVIQNVKLNKAINKDTYNVADALEVNSVKLKTDFRKNLEFDALASAAEKAANSTKDILVNADNRDITPEEFSKTYNTAITENATLNNDYKKLQNKIFNSKIPQEKRDIIIKQLRTLGISGGYSPKDIEDIQKIFKANGMIISYDNAVKYSSDIRTLTEQQSKVNANNYEINRLNKNINLNLDDNKINLFAKTYNLDYNEAKEFLKDALINPDSHSKITENVYSSEKRMKKLAGEYNEKAKKGKGNLQSWNMVRDRNIRENSSLMYLSARKFLKSNNIKIDPKVLQVQRYGFSNSDENSLTGDFNTRITTAINEAGIDNFTSGGISLQKKLNDEEIKDANNKTVKVNNAVAISSLPLSDTQILVTFKGKDSNDKEVTFKVPVDIKDNDGTNIKERSIEYHIESAKNMPYGKKLKEEKGEGYNKTQAGHVVAVSNLMIDDNDKVELDNLPNGDNMKINAGNLNFKIYKMCPPPKF